MKGLFLHIQKLLTKVTAPSQIGRAGGESVILLFIISILFTAPAQAQDDTKRITIGGRVYGGGNQGNVNGNTTVNVRKGDIQKVFGGARQANVGGRAFVNIDGENASGDIFVTEVYGGNDVSGTIGTSTVPKELENVKTGESDTDKTHNAIDNTWNAYVHTSRSSKPDPDDNTKEVENYAIIIGSLYGGGNGAFTYTDDEGNDLKDDSGNYIVKEGDNTIAISDKPFNKPELAKTYLELKGGDIAHVYGGGNNATVTENTTINIDNESQNLTELIKSYAAILTASDPEGVKKAPKSLTDEEALAYYANYTYESLKSRVGLNMFQSTTTNTDFNFARVFGGNNQAEMKIRPTWNLQRGSIRDLYSGGNKGNMTSPEGLLLEIDPVESDKLVVDNVFGGCRMADVIPTVNGVYTPCSNLPGYNFPNELSARVLVRGGDINNVYGGNDITGNVKGGNAIGIYSSIRGDVYGGGNGAYAYTDQLDNDEYSDFWFDAGSDIITSLNEHRPNAEQVSIRIAGKAPANPDGQPTYTSIHGSIYCGGNCATLKTVKNNPMVELKIGSYAIADNVFLGNNGAKMVDKDILKLYAGKTIDGYSGLNLTDESTFAKYMEGAAMDLQPSIVFDSKDNQDPDDYKDFTSYVGSFFCGGNVGSMIIPGINTYKVSRGLNIYNKFVGGCNNAYVPVIKDENGEALNAAYDGGILGSSEEQNDYTEVVGGKTKIKDRLEIDLDNLTITPLRWDDETNTHLIWNTNKWKDYSLIEAGTVLAVDDVYYTYNTSTEEYVKHTVTGSPYTVTASNTDYELYQDFEPVENNTVNTFYPVKDGTQLTEDETYYTYDSTTQKYTAYTAKGDEIANGTNYYTREHEVRLLGGNVYGGCYNSGHVNGNIVVNINEDVLKRDEVFGYGTSELYGRDKSGVSFLDQRDDLNAVALIVFGGGYGEDSEVWGSTTVNLNSGYVFQICGGGEKGIVGKGETKTKTVENETVTYKDYSFDLAYSSTVNLKGSVTATSSDEVVDGLAESEYLYGGGKEGLVCGNTYVNLGNGRIYDAFAGASEADVLGHTELYIGRQPNGTPGTYKNGFPWISDNVYGSNDFCGKIHGNYETGYDFTKRIENYDTKKSMLHGFKGAIPDVMKSATYVEYLAGRVDTIFGGSYGFYDYKDVGLYGEDCSMPQQKNTFVNIRPRVDDRNAIKVVFGGGTGYPKNRDGDKMQDRSYVLIDIPDGVTKFKDTEVFGAGSYNGLGMNYKVADTFKDEFGPDSLSAIIDLLHGEIGAVYGGSFNEGVTARTVINVPAASTIKLNDIFGGAYGTQILPPCDVFESNIFYSSDKATVTGAIYGGNNNERRTLYTHVNISAPVWSDIAKGYTATVYGAGNGVDTWSEYTDVNLLSGAKVYEVYGGGKMGHVLNAESVQKYMQLYKDGPSNQIATDDPFWKDSSKWTLTDGVHVPNTDALKARWAADWADAWTLGDYYKPADKDGSGNYTYADYVTNTFTNLDNTAIVTSLAEIDDRDYTGYTTDAKARHFKKFNTNVRIHEGATVVGYAYGGGLGDADVPLSGDTYGNTYIALLGGKVEKDLYAAGTTGAVYDLFGVGAYDATDKPYGFTASATAYVKGGSCRNVYGGGWKGDVGYHDSTTHLTTTDNPGETHVVIGDIGGTGFTNGIPSVQRNAYGGGEGGAVVGTANITLNNGYIGYVHLNINEKQDANGQIVKADVSEGLLERYDEKIIDETHKDKESGAFIPNTRLYDAGCLFGGGYVDHSSVDKTNVTIYGGHIRNSAFGGGEIAAIGRGAVTQTTNGDNIVRTLSGLYRPGKTHLEMFGGQVHRNVFGGGRGYDNLGGYGQLHTDGCVFGQTEVHIHGGEIGSSSRLAYGDGNVFGGGDIGYVYSAYENAYGTFGKGVKSGVRYNQGLSTTDPEYNYQGYYYKHDWADDGAFVTIDVGGGKTERQFTEDCKVLIEPHCKSSKELSYTGIKYGEGEELATEDLEYLKQDATGNAAILAKINDEGIVTDEGGITFSRSYPAGSYVPIAALNTMAKKSADARWKDLDSLGIIIHNGVFAGGNTPSGKSATSANTASVFGNATASIHDVYHRDLITLGTGHTGGLYGDGNLTLVDGYRELNITNYGTDYYSIDKEISINRYKALPDREAAYYELKYTCIEDCEDKDGISYKKKVEGVTSKASTITAEELLAQFLTEVTDEHGIVYYPNTTNPVMKSIQKPYPAESGTLVDVLKQVNDEWVPNTHTVDGKEKPYFWEESGVLPVYAGRLMNSIQRADFCGVYGSRMVMQGARDRVPDEADFTNYTINRVREVSLNKKISTAGDAEGTEAYQHGNYFGIYNIVNYLGALTSDVDFGDATANTYNETTKEWLYDVRSSDNDNHEMYDPDWDPTKTGTNLKSGLTTEQENTALDAAAAIDGVTVDKTNKTITASTVEGLYKLRSVPNIEFTTPTQLTGQTFYEWKKTHRTERKRNNGNSHNKVALASGVYLELTTEESTGNGLYEKVWGPITGVIELDLINVSTGIGGGFVYAKNVHGVRSKTGYKNTTLTALNSGAVTHWDYDYKDPDTYTSETDQMEWETSGNFVHSTQTIIDDCYNVSNRYVGNNKVPAHYWYIKGSVYVYDQYISAYTGSPNAFSEAVDIPLTITAASHGSMKLLDVKPNLYAYYSSSGVKIADNKVINVNDKSYSLNDPISYWDWYLLTKSEQALFVPMTYVNCVTVNIDDAEEDGKPKTYAPGTYVMTENEYKNFGEHTYKDADGEIIKDADDNDATTSYIFRPSNNLGHDTGYILTYQVNNPSAWDTWYTPKSNNSTTDYTKKKTLKEYNALTSGKEDYEDGPTYRLDPYKLGSETSKVLGQSLYEVGDIISKNIEDAYPYKNTTPPDGQATFKQAYLITQEVTINDIIDDKPVVRHMNPGAAISAAQLSIGDNDTRLTLNGNYDKAYVCTKTIQVSKTDLIYRDTKMTEAQRTNDYIDPLFTNIREVLGTSETVGNLKVKLKDIRKIEELTTEVLTNIGVTSALTDAQITALKPLLSLKNDYTDYFVPAYYCTKDGLYGGRNYVKDTNYRGLETWSSMSEEDRAYFRFNYDALDLLTDKNYSGKEGKKYQYDGETYNIETEKWESFKTKEQVENNNLAKYSLERALDYTATYKGATDATQYNGITLTAGKEYSSEEYESLPNEQRHYVALHVKDGNVEKDNNDQITGYNLYVVNQSFQIGNTPYAVGTTISEDTYLGMTDRSKVTKLTFTTDAYNADSIYYYCRESYKVGYNGNGVSVANVNTTYVKGCEGYNAEGNSVDIKPNDYTDGANDVPVPIGLIIDQTRYDVLTTNNKQKDFTFHGVSPTETSTLYVSNESDIYNLSKDKIITVVYEYNYEESDANGNVTPVSERHVLNIHVTFESGVPTVEDIEKPEIILPGDFISLSEPNVTPGAYELTGGGWELFETPRDAETHANGIPYNPTFDPLYWYQHDWYIAYYAKSYLGRTYSNAVPVSVANYHDLANVMSDLNKTHHMYIDNKNVKRAPKIYINDYSKLEKNGLDELKRLFDLSVLTYTNSDLTDEGLLKSGTFEGHKPLDNRVKGAANLEFFLRTDIDHTPVTKANPAYDPQNPGDTPATITTGSWSSIGNSSQCFDGIIHGDGHTITGLDHSLFGDLCGEVYNLGVTGSFTTAGVADTDTKKEGYVESCWVKTSDTTAKGVKAVFGAPQATDSYQVVNCYYPESNHYTTGTTTSPGTATEMADEAFYNGEVAYDLNNFYLHKRYANATGSVVTENKDDRYLTVGADNELTIQPYKTYENRPDICSSGYIYTPDGSTTPVTLKYVEDRFANEDFRYADGKIPTEQDDRYYAKKNAAGEVEEYGYYPIWPDDYLFFGQKLTYGWATEAHQDLPSAIVKSNGRLPETSQSNRVYRAPAYYRSSSMDVAHFNPDAYLAQKEKLTDEQIAANVTPREAHPNMTAIDFAGHYENNTNAGTYQLGWYNVGTQQNHQDLFYLPLLDDDGLTSIENCDETQNLLVYAPAASGDGYVNKKTYDVLTSYFDDPSYDEYYNNSNGYRIVSEAPAATIHGHLVQSDLTASTDHLLVDKQEFFAPMSYTFAKDMRMWYQRTPDNFVDRNKGWEGVSLPFTAELVTTHQKGEITHFYSGSTSSANSDKKIGHEYWLREFKGIKEEGTTPDFVAKAQFNYPTASGADKTVTNHFLWNYYYEGSHGHKDKNSDIYQHYYEKNRSYTSYPLLSTATPYLIGFPGQTYYEFDLSGTFEAENTGSPAPAKLDKQIITFASAASTEAVPVTIARSDTEMTGVTLTSSENKNYSFTFKPNYLKETMETTDNAYTLKADGSQFDQVTSGSVTVLPFRPYFTATSSAKSSVKRELPEFIVFSGDFSEPGEEEPESALSGDLVIYAQGRNIITTSYLKEPVAIRITSVNGVTITNYALQPGQTITTPMNAAGAYIVNKKKIFIK